MPDLLTSPAPARAALTVPACRSKVTAELSVPLLIVPPVRVRPPSCVWLVPPRFRVPPLTARVLPVSPSVPEPVTFRVPAATVVPPV